MANVVFKRGLQSALNNMNSVEDGVFYLTTDTNRLYVGQGTTKKLLNQTVQIVPRINDLTALSSSWSASQKADHVYDFYYVTGQEGDSYRNILVVWTEEGGNYEWKQINPDHNTVIDSASFSATANSNVGTITLTLGDTDSGTTTGSFSVSGTGSAVISSTSGGLVITGKEYSITNKIDANATSSTDIYLAVDSSTANGSKISISAAADSPITVLGINGGIVIGSNNTSNVTATFSVSTGTLSYVITDSDESSVTATVSNVGIILNDNSYVPIASTSGATAGALYSKAEIDTMINGLNGMTYKGTLGNTGSTTALPSTQVKNGDTYIIVQSGLTAGSSIFDGATFATGTSGALSTGTTVGDMIIASGTEGSDGYISSNLQWTYVPSGNDSLDAVTYSTSVDTANNAILLANENGTIVSKLGLTAGTDMALSSTSSTPTSGNTNSAMTTTISHATISTTSAQATTLSDGTTSFTAVKSITVNNGHVTAIETDVFTPATFSVQNSVSQSSGTAVLATISLYNDAEEVVSSSASFNITSSSLKVTANTASNAKDVVINLEWGTF